MSASMTSTENERTAGTTMSKQGRRPADGTGGGAQRVSIVTWLFVLLGALMLSLNVYRFKTLPGIILGRPHRLISLIQIFAVGFVFAPLFFSLAGVSHGVQGCLREGHIWVSAALTGFGLLVMAAIWALSRVFVAFIQGRTPLKADVVRCRGRWLGVTLAEHQR